MGIGRFFFGSNYVRMQNRPSMKSRYGRSSSKSGTNAIGTKSNSYKVTKQTSSSSVAQMMDLSTLGGTSKKSQRTLQKLAKTASYGGGLLDSGTSSTSSVSDLFSADIPASGQQIVKVPESTRQALFDETKRQFIENNGSADEKSAQRAEIYQDYLKGTSKKNQASGTWTLSQYESQYRDAMKDAIKASNPSWKEGQPFNAKALDSVTRTGVENRLVSDGVNLSRRNYSFFA
ncbi:MAG: DUF3879 family protein [Oscillospiraceae bacterium]|nr:DUF3879 family protein [Oscillospiraceae bacterium]